MNFEIRRVTASETLAVRMPVLRPGFPPESAIFDGDDAPATLHFGACAGSELIGVVSIYRVPFPDQPNEAVTWQLRGMAVMPEWQGRGVGEALLSACVDAARHANGRKMWCNARRLAVRFYEKHRWEVLGDEFEIPTVGPHFRMWLRI
jgi:GNAT superfamily N-acetyltransferase